MQKSQIYNANTLCTATISEPIMTRQIRTSRHVHHRGHGDGSFNQKYASSPLVSQRMIGACIDQLTRSPEPLDNELLSEGNDFQVFQRRHTASTIASSILKAPSLHSIGENDTYNDDDTRDDSTQSLQIGDIVEFQKKNTMHSSLRCTSVSIRSLPREIELMDEDGDDDVFSLLTDEECMRGVSAPSMIELQDSLRSIDASILHLPREKELMEDEQEPTTPQARAATKKRVSFASTKTINNYRCQHQNWQSWNASSQDIAQLQQNLSEMREKVESMAALIASMNEKISEDHSSPPRPLSRKLVSVARSA